MPAVVIDRVARHNHNPPGPCQNGARSGPRPFADLQALEAAAAGWPLRNGCGPASDGALGFQGFDLGNFPPGCHAGVGGCKLGLSEQTNQWHAPSSDRVKRGVPCLLTALSA